MVKHYIQAARLRTLPLSVAGIIVGGALAYASGFFNTTIFLLSFFTTIGFQILSNFANDYGDGVKGTDNDDRIGPKRAIQSGTISTKQMLKAIITTGCLTFVIALFLIYFSFGKTYFKYSVIFIVLGIACIIAAIKYTVGKNAYGYSGLGDLFVFIFFGLVSVCGSYFLYAKSLDYTIFLPAISIGLLSVAVLNLNNMRDITNDEKAKKNTIVVKMGSEKAKYYHYFLLIGSFATAIAYNMVTNASWKGYLFMIAFIPIFIHLVKVMTIKKPVGFDPELKKVALSTFLFALLFGLGMVL